MKNREVVELITVFSSSVIDYSLLLSTLHRNTLTLFRPLLTCPLRALLPKPPPLHQKPDPIHNQKRRKQHPLRHRRDIAARIHPVGTGIQNGAHAGRAVHTTDHGGNEECLAGSGLGRGGAQQKIQRDGG